MRGEVRVEILSVSFDPRKNQFSPSDRVAGLEERLCSARLCRWIRKEEDRSTCRCTRPQIKQTGYAENHELCRTHRSHSHHGDQPAVIDVVLRHRRPIAANEVGLAGGLAHERTRFPEAGQKSIDCPRHDVRESDTVELEDDPLQSALEGVLDEYQKAVHVDVFPVLVRGSVVLSAATTIPRIGSFLRTSMPRSTEG